MRLGNRDAPFLGWWLYLRRLVILARRVDTLLWWRVVLLIFDLHLNVLVFFLVTALITLLAYHLILNRLLGKLRLFIYICGSNFRFQICRGAEHNLLRVFELLDQRDLNLLKLRNRSFDLLLYVLLALNNLYWLFLETLVEVRLLKRKLLLSK